MTSTAAPLSPLHSMSPHGLPPSSSPAALQRAGAGGGEARGASEELRCPSPASLRGEPRAAPPLFPFAASARAPPPASRAAPPLPPSAGEPRRPSPDPLTSWNPPSRPSSLCRTNSSPLLELPLIPCVWSITSHPATRLNQTPSKSTTAAPLSTLSSTFGRRRAERTGSLVSTGLQRCFWGGRVVQPCGGPARRQGPP
jgi:hypothetical protein